MSYERKNVQDGITVMNKALYDNLQDGIDELKETSVAVNTAIGENIIVTDSADAPVRKLKVKGKTEQFTTTGKNLLPTINENTNIFSVYTTTPTKKENSITGGWAYNIGGFDGFGGCTFSVKMRHADTTTKSRPVFTFRDDNDALVIYNFGDKYVNTYSYSMIIPEGATNLRIDYGTDATAELILYYLCTHKTLNVLDP